MFEPLAPYARMGAALCPIPAGAKLPTGLIGSFADDWSRDPAVWNLWSQKFPGCNWIMVAGPSGRIIVDIDVKRVGRDPAWKAWCDWCASNGLPVFRPNVTTPSGGWHIYFDVPAGVAPETLRQPALVAGIIDTRAANGFVLIPPSVVDGKAYTWLI